MLGGHFEFMALKKMLKDRKNLSGRISFGTTRTIKINKEKNFTRRGKVYQKNAIWHPDYIVGQIGAEIHNNRSKHIESIKFVTEVG